MPAGIGADSAEARGEADSEPAGVCPVRDHGAGSGAVYRFYHQYFHALVRRGGNGDFDCRKTHGAVLRHPDRGGTVPGNREPVDKGTDAAPGGISGGAGRRLPVPGKRSAAAGGWSDSLWTFPRLVYPQRDGGGDPYGAAVQCDAGGRLA